MNQVLQANTRTGGAIDMIELILAGSIILEIVAFAIGEISSDQTIFRSILDGIRFEQRSDCNFNSIYSKYLCVDWNCCLSEME